MTPPGPRTRSPLGSLNEFRHNRLAFLRSLPQYGDITFMRLGREPVYTLHHPDLIQQALVTQAHQFQKLRLTRNLFGRVVKSDVALRQTPAWKQRREAVQSTLHAQKIEQYAATMADLTRQQMSGWFAPIDVFHEMRHLTLLIVARTLFGSDLSSEVQSIMSATGIMQEQGSKRFNTPFALPLWIPTPHNVRVKGAVSTLDRVVQGMIDDYMAENDSPRSDITALLLQMAPETLTLPNIREEMISLLMSGHETTATALSWLWCLLAEHSDVEARMIAEIDTALQGRSATPAALPDLPYAQAVVKETLRLYPPSWVISRKAVEDVCIGGCEIPRHATVFISPYSLHHDERWFDQPNMFKPERFLEGEINRGDIHRFAYLPFSIGPRKCIGSAFATLEILLIAVTVLQRMRLVRMSHEAIIPEALITLRPRQPIIVSAVTREA
ncbi:MAG: cytochrome P450 [Burkholderiales bacterium]|nr:cytochrome P450 [Anaerolineae bacterium]